MAFSEINNTFFFGRGRLYFGNFDCEGSKWHYCEVASSNQYVIYCAAYQHSPKSGGSQAYAPITLSGKKMC